jgi:hypothetical protein
LLQQLREATAAGDSRTIGHAPIRRDSAATYRGPIVLVFAQERTIHTSSAARLGDRARIRLDAY